MRRFLKSSSILTVLRMNTISSTSMLYGQHLASMFIRQFNDLFFNKLKNNMALLSIFPSFTFLSFTFLLNFFCFSSLGQRVVLLNFLDTKVNSSSLLFFTKRETDRQTDRLRERERERESRRSPVLRGWSGGAG